MNNPQQALTRRFHEAIIHAFGQDYARTDPLIRPAQNPRFGDYQANVAMSLAKRLGGNPREVAAAIIEHLDVQGLCEVPEIAGPGFINLTLTPGCLAAAAIHLAQTGDRLGVEPVTDPQTVVVDYSSPNVAKEMHVGHLRSTVIGDALARALGFLGHNVIRQNHVGDWGTQFGMLIEYLSQTLDPSGAGEDYEIGDLNSFYQNAKKKFDADPAFADAARERVVALQSGDEPTLEMWRWLIRESNRHFHKIYQRLGVQLTDADIRAESFYNPMLGDVVDELEQKGLTRISDGAVCVFLDEFTGTDDQPVPIIIRKSGGGYLYATTDLAAIRYRIRELDADRIIYVTDSRQRQHFAMVFLAAEKAGWLEGGERLEHVPFGTILGENGKPFKTRSGDTVRLVDLLDEAEQRAETIVTQKNPALDEIERARVAGVVGIGAVKYADLANDRVKDYVFNWDRMLSMEGNTAPYLQYAYARIRSIFRKADAGDVAAAQRLTAEEVGGEEGVGGMRIEHSAERALVLKLVQFDSVVRAIADGLEPHRLCTWLHELAVAFSSFYENCPVLRADSPEQRAGRLMLCDVTARGLKRGLNLLGIEVLDRM